MEQYIWLLVSQNEYSWQPTTFRRWICQTLSYSASFNLWGILISAAMRLLNKVFGSGSILIKQEHGLSSCQFSVHFSLNSLAPLTEIIGKVTIPCLHRFLLSMAWVQLGKKHQNAGASLETLSQLIKHLCLQFGSYQVFAWVLQRTVGVDLTL